jgi:hypothetical protein
MVSYVAFTLHQRLVAWLNQWAEMAWRTLGIN